MPIELAGRGISFVVLLLAPCVQARSSAAVPYCLLPPGCHADNAYSERAWECANKSKALRPGAEVVDRSTKVKEGFPGLGGWNPGLRGRILRVSGPRSKGKSQNPRPPPAGAAASISAPDWMAEPPVFGERHL